MLSWHSDSRKAEAMDLNAIEVISDYEHGLHESGGSIGLIPLSEISV